MKRFLIPSAVALIVAAGLFLPNAVTGVKDRQMLGEYVVTSGGDISFETQSEMGILDRLRMLRDGANIPVENGKKRDADTALRSALTELDRFNVNGIMSIDFGSCWMNGYDVTFNVDAADPAKNMIVWSIYLEDDAGHIINVALDDETGVLLSVDYISKNEYEPPSAENPPMPSRAEQKQYDGLGLLVEPEALSTSISDYYGLLLASADVLRDTGFLEYELRLSDGSGGVTMQVAVTSGEFLFNI